MNSFYIKFLIICYIIRQFSHLGLYYSGGELMIDSERFEKANECNRKIYYAIQRLKNPI
jgi:hypothetical protein